MQYNNFSSCTSPQWAWAENADLDHNTFRPTSFFQSTFWAKQPQLTSFFVWRTVGDNIFLMVACHYTVEQCASDKKSEHSFSPSTF